LLLFFGHAPATQGLSCSEEPKVKLFFKVRPHRGPVQGDDPYPAAAGHTISATSREAVGLLGHLGARPAHTHPTLNQHSQVLFLQAAFQTLCPKPEALHTVVVT